VVGDRAGFVANALLFGYLNAGARAAETGQAAVADIDAAVVAACGVPMGPLTLMDLIGLDVSLDVMETMFEETRDQRYAPAPLLRRLVMAGDLGRKTGRGYYRYDGSETIATLPAPDFSTGTARPTSTVVMVASGASALHAAMPELELVEPDETADADVVIIDGGSRVGTAELLARVVRVTKAGAVVGVATTDEAPVLAMTAGLADRGYIVGVHRPHAPRGGVIEVVATLHSHPDAVATMVAATRGAGLAAIACRDRPGHIVDHLVQCAWLTTATPTPTTSTRRCGSAAATRKGHSRCWLRSAPMTPARCSHTSPRLRTCRRSHRHRCSTSSPPPDQIRDEPTPRASQGRDAGAIAHRRLGSGGVPSRR
jgi:3-hydroxybutyryl-CoA dehydrogenase